jgi:hypothetical protein
LKVTKSFLIAFRFITDTSKSRVHKYNTYMDFLKVVVRVSKLSLYLGGENI